MYAKLQSFHYIFCNAFSVIQCNYPAITHCENIDFGSLILLYDRCRDFSVILLCFTSGVVLLSCAGGKLLMIQVQIFQE